MNGSALVTSASLCITTGIIMLLAALWPWLCPGRTSVFRTHLFAASMYEKGFMKRVELLI